VAVSARLYKMSVRRTEKELMSASYKKGSFDRIRQRISQKLINRVPNASYMASALV